MSANTSKFTTMGTTIQEKKTAQKLLWRYPPYDVESCAPCRWVLWESQPIWPADCFHPLQDDLEVCWLARSRKRRGLGQTEGEIGLSGL